MENNFPRATVVPTIKPDDKKYDMKEKTEFVILISSFNYFPNIDEIIMKMLCICIIFTINRSLDITRFSTFPEGLETDIAGVSQLCKK